MTHYWGCKKNNTERNRPFPSLWTSRSWTVITLSQPPSNSWVSLSFQHVCQTWGATDIVYSRNQDMLLTYWNLRPLPIIWVNKDHKKNSTKDASSLEAKQYWFLHTHCVYTHCVHTHCVRVCVISSVLGIELKVLLFYTSPCHWTTISALVSFFL